MRSNFLRFFAASLIISFVFIATSNGQKDDALSAAAGDRYVISAKAGHVNYVEGSVTVVRKAGRSGLLLKGDKLELGDRVTTGVDGKAEILLNPGSFLRLGGLTVFEFETTDLDNLKLQLDSGSAILEVFATDEFSVSVETPKTSYKIVATGVYRIDIPERGDARLEVWKGLALVGDDEELVKGGRAATTAADGSATVAKFDRDEKDALDIWSKERGKELARVSSRLKRVNLRSGLMGAWGSVWNMFSSFGLWIYDPFYGGYCFLPFGYGWNSPYGYGYNHCIRNYHMPPTIYNPPVSTPTGGSNAPVITPIVTAGVRGPVPPFIRLESTMGGGGIRGGSPDRGGAIDYGSSNNSSPSYSPPSSSPPSSPTRDSSPTTKDTGPTKQP